MARAARARHAQACQLRHGREQPGKARCMVGMRCVPCKEVSCYALLDFYIHYTIYII